MNKICSKCKTDKPIDEFTKRKKSKDGYNSQCKICAYSLTKISKKKYDYSEKEKEYYIKNKEYYQTKNKEYRLKNKEKENKRKNEYVKKRCAVDAVYRMKIRCRKIFSNAFKNKGYMKNSRTHDILGCSFEEFKQHIESLWESWMNWDNYGLYNGTPNYGWDIDHVIPSSSATTEDDVIKLNHFSNLQPLCSYINRDVKRDFNPS